MGHRDDRPQISDLDVARVIEDVESRIKHAFKTHGKGILLNGFEVLVILQLECDEFKAEIQNHGSKARQRDELLDIATVALLAAASIGKQ